VAEYEKARKFDTNIIVFGGGGTLFSPAFELAYNVCSKHTDVDNVIILISDG
jgi:hypothetical protein